MRMLKLLRTASEPEQDANDPVPVRPAEMAWRQHLSDLDAVSAEQAPLSAKLADFQQLIARDESDHQLLGGLVARQQTARADILIGIDKSDDLKAIDEQITAVRRRIAGRGDEVAVTRLAATKLQGQLEVLTGRVAQLQELHAALAHALIVERMKQEAGRYGDALDAFLQIHEEVAALAAAADKLGPRIPGTRSVDSGAMLRLEVNMPTHGDYRRFAGRHDIRKSVNERAMAVLAGLKIGP